MNQPFVPTGETHHDRKNVYKPLIRLCDDPSRNFQRIREVKPKVVKK